jgi:hypothetical protein
MTLASTEICILSASDPAWDEALTRVPHDIFHTALYHRAPALGVSGTPEAFLFQENDQTFLWPYYRVPIPAAPGYFDVNSAYGYPGPVGRGQQPFFQRAWHALLDHWRQTGVVSVFTRFNPLLQNVSLLDGVTDPSGEPAAASIRELGLTVSVDLTLAPEEQLRRYQKRLRQTIRKLYDQGFTVAEDTALQHLPDFVRMYNQTMARLMSRPEYRLELDWFENFRAALGPHLRLLVCRHGGRLAAAPSSTPISPEPATNSSTTARPNFYSISRASGVRKSAPARCISEVASVPGRTRCLSPRVVTHRSPTVSTSGPGR